MTDTSSPNNLQEADKDFLLISYFIYPNFNENDIDMRKELELNYLRHKRSSVGSNNAVER
jgi:hypothetical protein